MSYCFSCFAKPFSKRESNDQLSEYNPSKKPWTFISRCDGVLFQDEKPFRFASFNIPGLLLTEDRNTFNSWVPPTPEEQEDAILTVKGAHGRVIRTYTLGFGETHHMSSNWLFYEPAWVAMDYALSLARKHRIRLIIPFINNHFKGDQGGPENFGDYWSLCNYRGLPPSAFYTSSILRQDLKKLIGFCLNRINTVNGIRYGDDPTVLAWQLGNELGGWDGPPPSIDWIFDIAAYVKSLAPNTLIMDGTMGGLSSSYMYQPQCLASPLLDIFDNHYYHGKTTDLQCIKKDVDLVVAKHKKVFILGEFGFDYETCSAMYDVAFRNKLISGALIWSLRYHSRDGGFYIHGEVEPEKGFWSFHCPGFSANTKGFSVDDCRMVLKARKYGLKMKNRSDDGLYPLPPPVRSTVRKITSPLSLSWMGSPWAASYNIYRKEKNSDAEVLLASNVCDGIATSPNLVLYSDNTAVSGHSYQYIIKPVSCNGVINHEAPLIISI